MFIPLIASLARLPREGSGTATPMPRKLKKLSVKMEEGICNVVVTISVPIQFVSKCFLMILPLLTPKALAAVTYSLSFNISTWLRTIRAIPTQYRRANTTKILIRFSPTVFTHPKPGTFTNEARGAFNAKESKTISRMSGTV